MQKPESLRPTPSPLLRFGGGGSVEEAKFIRGTILRHLADGFEEQ
jgi:hypothetical protein